MAVGLIEEKLVNRHLFDGRVHKGVRSVSDRLEPRELIGIQIAHHRIHRADLSFLQEFECGVKQACVLKAL